MKLALLPMTAGGSFLLTWGGLQAAKCRIPVTQDSVKDNF